MSRTKLLDGKLTYEQQRIAEYVEANASDVLVEKINQGKKGMSDCWNFIFEMARKEAKGKRSLCLDDQTVFGWAMHYFEEDDIKAAEHMPVKTVPVGRNEEKPKAAVPKEKPKAAVQKEKPKDDLVQMTIFDLMGGAQ